MDRGSDRRANKRVTKQGRVKSLVIIIIIIIIL